MADEKIDRYDLLKRMHERVEQSVFDADTPPRDLAALTRRLIEIGKEIEAIELQREQTGEGTKQPPADEPFDGSDV